MYIKSKKIVILRLKDLKDLMRLFEKFFFFNIRDYKFYLLLLLNQRRNIKWDQNDIHYNLLYYYYYFNHIAYLIIY